MTHTESPKPDHSPKCDQWWTGMLERSWRTGEHPDPPQSPSAQEALTNNRRPRPPSSQARPDGRRQPARTPQDRTPQARYPQAPHAHAGIERSRSSHPAAPWWSGEGIRGSVWPVWSLTVLVASVLVFLTVTPLSVWLHSHEASPGTVETSPRTNAGAGGVVLEATAPSPNGSSAGSTGPTAPGPSAATTMWATSTTTATVTVHETVHVLSPTHTVTVVPEPGPTMTATVPAEEPRSTHPAPSATASSTPTATATATVTATVIVTVTDEPTEDAPPWPFLP